MHGEPGCYRGFGYFQADLEIVGWTRQGIAIPWGSPFPTLRPSKPFPLTTIELTKQGSRLLRMSGDKIMKIAEELYQKGYISYPRTETNVFDPSMQLDPLIQSQVNDPRWGAFAQNLLNGGFRRPRAGRDNDKAHPPIHPVKDGSGLQGDDARIYEFIARRFLGCCSEDAKGTETVVRVEVGDEGFTARGLIVTQRNYLEVYTYDKWSDNEIPNFAQGERIQSDSLVMKEGSTQAPPLLSEADLITLMDKSGIGTDATIHDHIKTIQDREYVMKDGSERFMPTTLGYALIEGFDNMGFGFNISMSKPYLRRQMEADMKGICDGIKGPDEVIRDNVAMYKDVFVKSQQQIVKVETAVAERFGHAPENAVAEEIAAFNPVRNCPKCGQIMTLRPTKEGKLYIGCTSYPACK